MEMINQICSVPKCKSACRILFDCFNCDGHFCKKHIINGINYNEEGHTGGESLSICTKCNQIILKEMVIKEYKVK